MHSGAGVSSRTSKQSISSSRSKIAMDWIDPSSFSSAPYRPTSGTKSAAGPVDVPLIGRWAWHGGCVRPYNHCLCEYRPNADIICFVFVVKMDVKCLCEL